MLRAFASAMAAAAIVCTCGASAAMTAPHQRAHLPNGSFSRGVADAKWAHAEKERAARGDVPIGMNHSCGVQEARSL